MKKIKLAAVFLSVSLGVGTFVIPSPYLFGSFGEQIVKADDNPVEVPQSDFDWQFDDTNHTATLSGVHIFFGKDGNPANIILPSTVTKDGKSYTVTEIGTKAFYAQDSLTGVTLPENLTKIDDQAFEYAHITSIVFPKTLQSIGKDAFWSTYLSSIDFSQATSLTTIDDGAFEYTRVSSITLPENLKSLVAQVFLGVKQLTSLKLNANLETIGPQAFLYDHISNLDLTDAPNLTSIGAGAFEYNAIENEITMPANLATIGDAAFAGNNIPAIQFNAVLKSIAPSVFAYNKLTTLDIPSNVTTIGIQSFVGNQLTTVKLAGSPSVGTDAFTNNRITNFEAPNSSFSANSAMSQIATTQNDKPNLTANDLFDINMTDQKAQDLAITNLTNGVTYTAAGGFNIPAGVKQFSFDWTLTDSNGTNKIYAGHYNVNRSTPVIVVKDSNLTIGDSWSPKDNFVSAALENGQTIDFDSLKVTVKDASGNVLENGVNTNVAGRYSVTYAYGNDISSVATVNVNKKLATYSLSGNESVPYDSQTHQPDKAQYTVTMSNGKSYDLQDGDIQIENNAATPGTYNVVLTDQGKKAIESVENNQYSYTDAGSTATFTIVGQQQGSSKLSDGTKVYDGRKVSDSNFQPTLTLKDNSGKEIKELTLSDGQYVISNDDSKVGSYVITLSQAEIDQIKKDYPSYDFGDLSQVKSTYTITQAKATAKLSGGTKQYDGKKVSESHFKPKLTLLDSSGKAIATLDLSLGQYVIGKDGSAVGSYPITLDQAEITKLQAAYPNYDLSALKSVQSTYTITPAGSSGGSSSSSSSSSSSTGNGGSSSSSSSSSSTSDGTGSDSSSITNPYIPETGLEPGNVAAKGTVVYAIKKIGLYKKTDFSTANRRSWYVKKPRIYRPMFVVTGYARSKDGTLRYRVRDVNHLTVNRGKKGYITANSHYIRPVYYQSTHQTVTVINPRGVNSYRKADLTSKVRNYKQGTVLKVKRIVTHNLTTRYVLSNGHYITGNRKLVNMGRHKQTKLVRARTAINRYSDVNLKNRNSHYSKKQQKVFKVYGFDYSRGNRVSQRGTLRYRVTGGYITANAKYIRVIDRGY